MPRALTDPVSIGMFTVEIDEDALDGMLIEARDKFPFETGGVLLGYSTHFTARIEATIGPGPLAIHDRTSFTPDRDWQYLQIDDAFVGAGQTIQYLGDWHSHPSGPTSPSATDRELLRSTSLDPASQCERPLMVILGRDDEIWAAEFFSFTPGSHDRKELILSRRKIILS